MKLKRTVSRVLSQVAREDIDKLEAQKTSLKEEVDLRIVSELKGIEKVNDRISELDAAVKVYRDKGPGGLFKEDGLKQAAKLLETQGPERESLRSQIVAFNANAQKARDDLAAQHASLGSTNHWPSAGSQ